jgi:hypothetical protein
MAPPRTTAATDSGPVPPLRITDSYSAENCPSRVLRPAFLAKSLRFRIPLCLALRTAADDRPIRSASCAAHTIFANGVCQVTVGILGQVDRVVCAPEENDMAIKQSMGTNKCGLPTTAVRTGDHSYHISGSLTTAPFRPSICQRQLSGRVFIATSSQAHSILPPSPPPPAKLDKYLSYETPWLDL